MQGEGAREVATGARQVAPSQDGDAAVDVPLMGAAAAADNEQVLIGRIIKAVRERLDVSQGELARRLEIDRRQLSDWERGVVKAPSIAQPAAGSRSRSASPSTNSPTPRTRR